MGGALAVVDIPDAQKVVVSAACELEAVGAPFEPADLLAVALVGADERRLADSEVVVDDERVERAA